MNKVLKYLVIILGSIILTLVNQGNDLDVIEGSQKVKKVISINDETKNKLFESPQSNTTIEQINNHYLVQDVETQKQYVLTKDKTIDLHGKKMISYTDADEKVVLLLSSSSKELLYKNNNFQQVNNGKKVMNVQSAINRVKSETKQKQITFGGSNIRQTSQSGRLYYRVNAYQGHHLISTYRVYSDNGKIY